MKAYRNIAIAAISRREPPFRCLTLAWILLVIVGSLQPARPAAVVIMHRGIHYVAFAGTSLLLLLLARNRRQEILAVVATCFLGFSLEFMQHFVYHNVMEWRDVRDDAVAILAAYALYRLAGTCKSALAEIRSIPSP
jgi:hypothetical protein